MSTTAHSQRPAAEPRRPGDAGEDPPAPITFRPFGSGFRRDPYPHYRQLREEQPVHKTLGMWVLTHHADVRAVLHDRSFSAALIPSQISTQTERFASGSRSDGVGEAAQAGGAAEAARSGEVREAMRSGDAAGASGAARPMDAVAHGETRIARAETQIERLGRTSLVFTDNPEHARLRALVNRAFTARAIAELRPTVTRVAEELLGRVDGGEPLDLIADFAAPLPVAVLCEWMALPEDSRAEAGPRTRDIRFLLEPGLMKPADLARANAAVAAFTETLRPLIVARRATPGDDLISLLATASTGGVLTDDEVAALCVMCFVAGTETTKYLIGNAVLALLRHPEQAARLRADPALVPAAVAEALRYDCPLQLTKRLATRELEIGGARISAGDQVLLCLGAANRDPEAFDRPDEFDITRTAGDHLAFGHGMHGCLGGALATLQAEIALELLLPADVDLLGTDIDWQDDSFILRGPNRLPVTLRGSTR